MSSIDNSKDIYIYINSPGGLVSAGLAIYDTMNYVKCDIYTIGMGICASMGAFLLSSGTKGKRAVLPNTKVMIHQPLGGAKGQATDIMIVAEEIIKTKKLLNNILAKNTDRFSAQKEIQCSTCLQTSKSGLTQLFPLSVCCILSIAI